MEVSAGSLVAVLIATSFAAGINVYAVVAVLGILERSQLVALPPGLHQLQSWWVIGTAVTLFVVEFIADKTPAFDLVWNALQTFVRVPVAALLAYGATTQLSPELQMLSTVLGGLIAFVAHGGKTAVRAAVTPSPEPISNLSLSLGEDVLAVFLTWFATRHPYAAAGIALVGIGLAVLAIRFVIRSLKSLFRGAERILER